MRHVLRTEIHPRAAIFAGALLAATAIGGTFAPTFAADLTFDGFTIDEADKGTVKLGRVEVTGSSLERDEFIKMMAKGTPPDERKALAARFEAEKLSVPSISMTDKDGDMTVEGLLVTGISKGKITRGSISAMKGEFPADGGRVSFSSGPLTVEGADFGRAFGGPGGGFPTSLLIWEKISLTGPDKDTPATAPGGNLFTLEVAAITADASHATGAPTKSHLAVQGLTFRPPAASKAAQQLSQAGISRLDFGFDYGATYDPAAKTFSIDALELRGTDLGTLSLRGKIGNIAPEAFGGSDPAGMALAFGGGDPGAAPGAQAVAAALMQGTVLGLEIAYVDKGLADKVVAPAAAQQQKSPAALKAEAAAMARQMVPLFLGGAPNANAAADAVARFVAQPQSIIVTLKPKAGAIGFVELMSVGDPMALIAKVDIDVKSDSPAMAAPAPGPKPSAPTAAASPKPAPAPAAPAAPAAPSKALSGLDAWNALVGNTVVGKDADDNELIEYYLKNGTVKQLSDDQVSTGKWSFKDGQVCFRYPEEDEYCYDLTVDGDIATFSDEDGSGTRYTILKGNPKRL
jgi:hypothetical protein